MPFMVSRRLFVVLLWVLPPSIVADARRLLSHRRSSSDDSAFWSRQLGTSSYPSSTYTAIDRQLSRSDKQHPLQRNNIDLFLNESTNEACTPSQSSSATPILLLHGLTYSTHEFDVKHENYSLISRLLRECKTVWSLDIAGYGRSTPVSDGFQPDTDYAADDIRAAVQYITSRSSDQSSDIGIDLLGWSWGTNTATRYIENHPDDHRVRRAVLYAPLINAFDGSPETLDDFHANNWDHAASDFQVDANGNIDYTIAEPAVAHEFLSNCWRYDQNSSPNGGRRDLLAGSDVQLFDPTQIDVPVLMIGGSEDPLLYLDLLEEGFNNLPKREQSKMIIVEGAGHILMLEKDYHRRFQDAIVEFLS